MDSPKSSREPWNKDKLIGPEGPLKVKDIWAIRVRLQMQGRTRELALFDLGIDSKLRGCDLVKLRVRDVCHGDRVSSRGNSASAEDAAPGAIRDHAINPRRPGRVDQDGCIRRRRLFVPEPPACLGAFGYT